MHWRRKWQPTPVFLPGESQGPGSLVGCRLWGLRVGHDLSDLAAASAWRFLLFFVTTRTLAVHICIVSCYLASAPLSLFISSYLPALTLGIFTICPDETSLWIKVSCACQLKISTCLSTTNWYFPKAFGSKWTTRVFVICFMVTEPCLCCCSYWPSIPPEGIEEW